MVGLRILGWASESASRYGGPRLGDNHPAAFYLHNATCEQDGGTC